jgi:hypothetical protein
MSIFLKLGKICLEVNTNNIDMENTTIDLRKCEVGDILIGRSGAKLKYLGYTEGNPYPHNVKYLTPGLGNGSRTDEGFVFRFKRKDTDEDIVGIEPKKLS